LVTPAATAVSVTCCVVATGDVVTVNAALVFPDVTVTLDGAVAADVLELERDTVMPPAGAALAIVTVPVALAGPVTGLGETDTPVSA
jgi:hypothetical protein